MKIFKTKKYSILSNILKYSFVIVFGIMLMAPWVFVSACGGLNEPPCAGGSDVTSNKASDVTGGTNINVTIANPLGPKITDIPSFIKELINIVLIVGIPIVALFIIYTGFLFVTASGNPEKLTKAKSALLYTLIGAALLLGAFVIAQAIGATVDNIGKGV